MTKDKVHQFQIIDVGSHDELMSKRGEYYEMVMAQSLMEIGEDGEEYNPSELRKRRTTSRTVSHEPPEVGFKKREF